MSDIVNNVLRSKKIDDVNSSDKTDNVKKELKEKLNAIIAADKLTNIYFSEILIQ
jgi:flagellar basal body-associated protein FliL